jgi:pSer/pThr/pTyr-binding forkhead associated (FHA) protein
VNVTLEVTAGPLAGKKITPLPGQTVSIGRDAGRASFPVFNDTLVSGVHFAIECSENACRIRDLDSSNGTFVNGKRITEAELKSGDEIVAGKTHFFIWFEMDEAEAPMSSRQPAPTAPLRLPIPPQRSAPSSVALLPVPPLPTPRVAVPPPVAPPKKESPLVPATPQERLLAVLRGEFQPLYALLDAAVEPDVLKVLYESKEDHESLFEGMRGAQLVHFAPHLVRLPQKSPLLETLVQKAWGKHWGVYIACAKSLPELLAHLRQFLTVIVPGNRQMHFRYYDPRILRVFLPTCLPEEINQFFGPVKYFVMEDENPEVVLRFSNSGRGAERKHLPLSPPEKSEAK